MGTYRVTLINGDRRVELEGEEGVVKADFEKVFEWVSGPLKPASRENINHDDDRGARVTLRGFFDLKKPENASEAIALVLHYKKQHENKEETSSDEIRGALIQANFRPPGAMAQALTDCRRRFGYVEQGARKGFWRLSHQGETLVELDLPRERSGE